MSLEERWSMTPGSGYTIVPEGTSLTIWAEPGTKLSDMIGLALEKGDYQSIVNDPLLLSEVEGAASYLPGAEIPNYTLKAPSGLRIMQASTTVEDAIHLSSLLKPNMGHWQWAACASIRY